LETEVIETRFDFVLHDYQNEDWIFIAFCCRPQPNIMPSFDSAIAHDRQTAKRSIELDRSVDVATVDRYVCPARRHA
jgi:hypothetical protein